MSQNCRTVAAGVFAVAIAGGSVTADAAVLARYTFGAPAANGGPADSSPATYDPTTVDPAITASAVTAGNVFAQTRSDVAPPDYGDFPGSSGLKLLNIANALAADEDAAVAANKYVQFTITPGASPINIDSLQFLDSRGSTSETRGFAVRSSLDNYTSTLISVADIPTQYVEGGDWQFQDVDLSGNAAFQNLTGPVTFRFYVFISGVTSSRAVNFDDITINGSIVPEPATLCLLGLGALCMARRHRSA